MLFLDKIEKGIIYVMGQKVHRNDEKVRRIVNNNEPITDGAPIIFTERKDGVLPEYNIRTDRWDIALEAMNKMDMARKAKKETEVKPEDFGQVPNKKDGSPSEN